MFFRWHRFWTSVVGVGALVVAALSGASAAPTNMLAASCTAGTVTHGDTTSVSFCYTGAPQSWTVPPGVTGITVIADGAQGGPGGTFANPPALAGVDGNEYSASFRVTPGDTYTIEVGGAGLAGDTEGNGGAHGYNTGTAGNHGQNFGPNISGLGGGGGGGATALWNNAGSVLYLAAGGGGGGGGLGFALPPPLSAADGVSGGGGGGGGGYNSAGAANGAIGADGTNASDGSGGSPGSDYCKTGVSTCAESPLLAAAPGDGFGNGMLTIVYPPLTALPVDTKTPTPPAGPLFPDIIITLPTTTTPTTTPTATPTPGSGGCDTATVVPLSGQWTLVAWPGKDGMSVADALSACTDITSKVAVIWGFDASTQTYEAYFPSAGNVPGANDLATLTRGSGYWVALHDPSTPVTWRIEAA